MDLINILPHRRNGTVQVGGRIYPIDGAGVCRSLPEAAAAEMLENEAWQPYDAGTGGPKTRTVAAAARPKLALIGAGGEVVTKPEAKLDPPPAELPPASAEGAAEYKVPVGDEEWPDPTEEMPLEYLRQMAEAYDVQAGGRIAKKTLVQRIHDAMYPDHAG